MTAQEFVVSSSPVAKAEDLASSDQTPLAIFPHPPHRFHDHGGEGHTLGLTQCLCVFIRALEVLVFGEDLISVTR